MVKASYGPRFIIPSSHHRGEVKRYTVLSSNSPWSYVILKGVFFWQYSKQVHRLKSNRYEFESNSAVSYYVILTLNIFPHSVEWK